MVSMRNAILANPTLAESIRQENLKRQQAQQQAQQRRVINRARYQRDAAIAALLKARRQKKKSRPIMERVLQAVTNLRDALSPRTA
jgi:hypothetical protein